MKIHVPLTTFLIALLLAACQTATPTPDPPPIRQPPGVEQPCAYSWHNESLPDHAAEVSAALEDAGFDVVSAAASAFGENCMKDGEVASFGAISTDYTIELNVDDPDELENTAAEVIALLITEFPADSTPGPQPGRIVLTVTAGSESIKVEANGTLARNAVEEGLEGVALLEAVGYEPGD